MIELITNSKVTFSIVEEIWSEPEIFKACVYYLAEGVPNSSTQIRHTQYGGRLVRLKASVMIRLLLLLLLLLLLFFLLLLLLLLLMLLLLYNIIQSISAEVLLSSLTSISQIQYR